MSKEIIWSTQALYDLTNVLEYLNEKWSEKIANDFLDTLDYNVTQVSKQPSLFPYSSREHSIRRAIITKHNTLYFYEATDNIKILRLFDTRQNPEKFKLY